MNKYYFGTLDYKYVDSRGLLICKQVIAIKGDYGLPIVWTNYHKYIQSSEEGISHKQKNLKRKYNYVCKFLNYLWDEKGIEALSDIKKIDIEDFLNQYGKLQLANDSNSTHRKKETVKIVKDIIISFVEKLIDNKEVNVIKVSDLVKKIEKYSTKKGRNIGIVKPTFEIECIDNFDQIYRNVTYKAMNIIMQQIEAKHKDILMVALLGIYFGLRPSEALNVRREDSPLGQGLEFHRIDNEVVDIYADLRHKYNLRSDLIDVGGIKRKRKQQIHPIFINDFCRGYQKYMRYIAGHKYEEAYGPLTLNRDGKAMTYHSYLRKFKKVISEVIPIMLASDDREIVAYGMNIQQHGLAPHIFRHYFSMVLADNGLSIVELKDYRGDRSKDAAFAYLQNKSDLTTKINHISNDVFAYNLWKAEEKYGKYQ